MGNSISISFNTDEKGFISQECPNCEQRFKVKIGEGSDEPISFCPYCDHTGRDCWWTREQAEYISAKAAKELVFPELDKVARSLNRAGRGFITMKTTVSSPPTPRVPNEQDDDWPTMVFDCCGETIRHDGGREFLFCIICGVETPVVPVKERDSGFE